MRTCALTKNVRDNLTQGSEGILAVVKQSLAVSLDVLNVSGELVLEGRDVSLDGVDQVAEVSLQGVSEPSDDLREKYTKYMHL